MDSLTKVLVFKNISRTFLKAKDKDFALNVRIQKFVTNDKEDEIAINDFDMFFFSFFF